MPTLRSVALAPLLALLALAACSDDGGGDGGAPEADESAVIGDADEGIEGVQSVRVGDPNHTEAPVDYRVRPPAGGAHHPEWANCGFYDEAIPDEHLVHDLEHGAVWLAYAPDLDPADVDALHDLARSNEKVIATPYEGLEAGDAVVATAWARQLRLDSVDDERLSDFIAQYVDGDQAPEAGVTCGSTNLGDPIP